VTAPAEPQGLGRRDAAVALGVGVTALLIAGLQPVILGGLEREGRLTAAQIGLAATVELLAIGVTCGLAASFLKPDRVRAKMAAASLAHAAAMAATTLVDGAAIIALRGLAGVFAGLMLWMAISAIARAARPERLAGIFVTLQTLAQLALAAILPATVAARYGTDGALVVLAAISALTALAALFGPARFAPLARSDADRTRLSPRALAGLAAAFLNLAFIVALWVYLEPLAALSGLTPPQAGQAVALALGFQVLGGASATALGRRWRPAWVLIGVGLANAVILAALWSRPDATAFVAVVAAFGFLWLFALPFLTLLLIEIDPTRRAAMQLGAAQLLGSSFGPLAASLVVGEGDVRRAILLSAVLLAVFLATVSALAVGMRRPVPEAGDSRG
jgi:hypothetical protein